MRRSTGESLTCRPGTGRSNCPGAGGFDQSEGCRQVDPVCMVAGRIEGPRPADREAHHVNVGPPCFQLAPGFTTKSPSWVARLTLPLPGSRLMPWTCSPGRVPAATLFGSGATLWLNPPSASAATTLAPMVSSPGHSRAPVSPGSGRCLPFGGLPQLKPRLHPRPGI